MLPDPSRAVAAAIAFFQARAANRPQNLEEAVAQGEAEAAATDSQGWIQIAGPRRRSWMRELRNVTSGPSW